MMYNEYPDDDILFTNAVSETEIFSMAINDNLLNSVIDNSTKMKFCHEISFNL